MLLLQSGQWDVWSFTWYDLDAVLLDSSSLKPTNLVHPKLDELRAYLTQNRFIQHRDVATRDVFDVFVDELIAEEETPWDELGLNLLFSQVRAATPADHEGWTGAVEELAPSAVRPVLTGIEPKLVVTGADDLSPWFSLHAVHDGQTLTVLAALDDDPEHWEDKAFRATWNGYLRLFQLLRGIDDIWFVTRHERDDLDFGPLLALRSIQPVEGGRLLGRRRRHRRRIRAAVPDPGRSGHRGAGDRAGDSRHQRLRLGRRGAGVGSAQDRGDRCRGSVRGHRKAGRRLADLRARGTGRSHAVDRGPG
jgi:hypothetical protein